VLSLFLFSLLFTLGLPTAGASSDVSPSITGFSPMQGPVGTQVVISGTGLSQASEVDFSGVAATSFSADSDTQITATVPQDATTGPISVVTPDGTAASADVFTVQLPPSISSFTPQMGPPGVSVTITGSHLTGATDVEFNQVSATFTADSDTQITATVPDGAATGPISVVTPDGTATSTDSFTVTLSPAITAFSPQSGIVGTAVTITGADFTNATDVQFNGVSGQFSIDSDTQITAVVPQAATTGQISVVTPDGTATSRDSFTVTLVAAYDNIPFESVPGGQVTANIATRSRTGSLPVVILIHGGKWVQGSKSLWGSSSGDLTTIAKTFGVVTMAVDYRMACNPLRPPSGVPAYLCGYHFPTPDIDVQAAVDWAQANIAAYGGDPNRIVLLGSSAGGQIADDIATQGHGVRAAGTWSAPSQMDDQSSKLTPIFTKYLGCSLSACPATWAAGSAVRFVSSATVPTYVANSTTEIIPLAYAQAYVNALNDAAVANFFRVISGSKHAMAYQGVKVSKGVTVLTETVRWLLAHDQ
jgi:acetyl esterase/lipase